MIAYIALLIQFINLLLRVFHGKQNHGRIVGGFLSEAWDKIRYTIHAVVSFVVAIWQVLLALYAGIFIHSSLKLIGDKVYFLYYRIMEIDDLTTLLWDRACVAVAATLAVALIVWTVYWFSYFIYVPLRFLFPWLLLLKCKLVGRGRIRWKPDRMMLKNRYVGDTPPVPTGVAAPQSLRIPRYTRVIPLLNDQQLAAALLEFGWKQDRYIREYESDPRYDHWRGWVRTPAAIEAAKVVAAVEEPIADAPPVPTGVAASRCLRIPRYTRVIPVLNDQQLAAALLEFDWKQDRYIREYESDPRYDHWHRWARTPAAIETREAVVAPADAVVEEPLADPVIAIDNDPVTEEEVVPEDVVVEVHDEEPDDPLKDPPNVEAPTDDSEDPVDNGLLHHDIVLEGEGEEEPLADPAVVDDDNSVAEEEIVPEADEEPDGALKDPPDAEELMDDSEEPVDDGVVQHDIIPDGEDQDLENSELPSENVDPVGIVVVAHGEKKVAHPVPLRRSPRLRQPTGSVFLSSNTGCVVRRSARIMSRR